MNMDKNYDYEDIEKITNNVVKILLKGNVPMEDIMYISGKSEAEIKNIEVAEG